MLNAIFLTIISLGCAKDVSDVPSFPSEIVWVAKPDLQKCSKHKIISKDPLKFDKGQYVDWSSCPDVFGFEAKDAGPVMNWIRNTTDLAKKRCK